MSQQSVTAAIAAETHESNTVVNRAVNQLRDEVLLIAEEGVFLGSEDDLLAKLGVSRTTFRQAIRILEYEELVTIKRGVGGGFYTRSPTANSVANLAAVYMSFRRTPLAQVFCASTVLRREAMRLIATSKDMQVRSALRRFMEDNSDFPRWPDRRAAIRVIKGFHQLTAQLAGNAALELFMNVVKMFGNRQDELFFTVERLEDFSRIMSQLAAAVEAGDAESAMALCDEEQVTALAWLEQPRK